MGHRSPLRIVSYNVRYFAHSLRGLTSTKKSMRGIAASLAALDPVADVVCLQEVETDSIRSTLAVKKSHPEETQLDRFMKVLGEVFDARGTPCPYEAYYFKAHTYRVTSRSNLYTTGLAILVKQPLVVERHNAGSPHAITHHFLTTARGAKQTRICAHLRIGGAQGIHIFNTHLSLPTPFARQFWTGDERMGYGPNQLAEVKALMRFVEQEAGGERFVVVGDFNSNPGSPVHAHLLGDWGLRDVQAEVQKAGVEQLKAWPTAGFMQLRMHLDHIFSSAKIEWLDLDESRPFGDRGSRFHGLSDHVPLVARLV